MARPRNEMRPITGAVEQLLVAVTRLVETVQTAVQDTRRVGSAAREVKGAASDTGRKIGSAVKSAWSRLTPAQRKARIAKMHAWRKSGTRGKKDGKAKGER